jgi:hypothetical protein
MGNNFTTKRAANNVKTIKNNSDVIKNIKQSINKTNIVDLFLFIGQSNMAGRGTVAEAPALIDGAGYEFKAVTDPTKLYPITEPFGAGQNGTYINDGTMKTGSMVTAFANAYFKQTGVPIVGVSASQGGTRISFWSSDGTVATEYKNRFNSALNWLQNNGYTVRHKYAVWCQGETDGDIGTTKENYKVLLNDLCYYRMNQDLGIEKTFIVRIGNYNGTNASLSYVPIIEAQTEYCKTSEYAVLVGAKFAGMKDRGLMKDEYHYTQTGYNEQGIEAGTNVAFYVENGKEPTMYDPQYDTLYYSKK